VEKYYEELGDRMTHREFEIQDSIHFNNSLKFTTPKGKIVYGGGGIMPDVFIPYDTTGITKYYESVFSKGLIYKFAFLYSDQRRATLSVCKNIDELISLLHNNNILDEFVEYSKINGIIPGKNEINLSGKLLENQIIANVGRNFFDDEGFYPVVLELDKSFKKAIEVLKG
jgi:carboxyl-terminal processing protease